tara:strand:+ start:732 stop:1067 length:336 start_codon:yes stop_codon:yes gene_type:complete
LADTRELPRYKDVVNIPIEVLQLKESSEAMELAFTLCCGEVFKENFKPLKLTTKGAECTICGEDYLPYKIVESSLYQRFLDDEHEKRFNPYLYGKPTDRSHLSGCKVLNLD